jgi:hypothetical protein
VGSFGDVEVLVTLAASAERHGWDGVDLWDHVLYHEIGWPVISSTVAAGGQGVASSNLASPTVKA